jgi:CRISPR-associated protein Csd1
MRAILTGGRYPRSLFAAVLMRLRAEHEVTGLRAAILKACLVRAGSDHAEGEISVSLDRENKSAAYRLGRLFAVFEQIQRDAQGRKVNATIRDRFYASASATPRVVFAILQRGSINHLAILRKSEKIWKRKNGEKYDNEIKEIMNNMSPEALFLPHLSLDDQGRFAIGYYHEKKALEYVPQPNDADDEEE